MVDPSPIATFSDCMRSVMRGAENPWEQAVATKVSLLPVEGVKIVVLPGHVSSSKRMDM